MIPIQDLKLIYFIFGILFIESLPIFEAIVTLIVQFIQMIQGYIAVIVTKQSAQITKIKNKAGDIDSSVHAIGFLADYDNEEYDDDDDDYEEDDE